MCAPIRAPVSPGMDIRTVSGILKQKVVKIQSQRPPFLVRAIETLIDKHYDVLSNHFQIKDESNMGKKSALFNILKERSISDYHVKKKRSEIVEAKQMKAPSRLYSGFLKSMYCNVDSRAIERRPTGDIDINRVFKDLKDYYMVNHEELYSSYCRLPTPPILHIQHNHVNDFITKFLMRRNFIKPNRLSPDIDVSTARDIQNFNEMLGSRKDIARSCSFIIEDLRRAGLPLTSWEQSCLVFMTFYRDRGNLDVRMKQAAKLLSDNEGVMHDTFEYNDFNWDIYTNLKRALVSDNNPDSTNTLLFHAFRHRKKKILNDVFDDLKLSHIHDENTTNTQETKANEKTIEIIIDHLPYLSDIYSDINLNQVIVSLMQVLSQKNFILDTRMINKIIEALFFVNEGEIAEDLIFSVFIPGVNELKDEELFVYSNYTFEDRQLYKELINVYKNIVKITGDYSVNFKLLPNESTFRLLLKFKCSQHNVKFATINNYLQVMQNDFGIPITTRMFKLIYGMFSNNKGSTDSHDWDLNNLCYFTSELISFHEAMYGITGDNIILNQIQRYDLEPNVRKVVQSFLDSQKTVKVPKYRGNFLKLSDELMTLIFDAFIFTIQNDTILKDARKHFLLTSIDTRRKEMAQHVNRTRKSVPRVYDKKLLKELIYTNDEITYVKKGYLFDLLDLVGNT